MNPAYYSKRRPFSIPHDQGTASQLKRAMAQINVRVLCENIYGVRKRDGYYFSPVREDGRNPAFEIRPDGEVGIDHATGEGFNALALIAKVENLTQAEARQRLILYAEHGGSFAPPSPETCSASKRKWQMPSWQCLPETRTWNTLLQGSYGDYENFAKLRGLQPVALMLAHAMGLFFFMERNPRVVGICTITDNARCARQDRCSNGGYLALKTGESAKSRTIGMASWPIGAANIAHKPVVMLVEGMPDLLAAVQVILEENRVHDTAPVAMLGAGQHINVHALPYFTGKHVRIFPDRDEAGAKGAATWAQQLQGVAASVDYFSFDAFPLTSPEPIKDLNDFIRWGGTSVCKHMIPHVERQEGAHGN
jgi:hypothetical protein